MGLTGPLDIQKPETTKPAVTRGPAASGGGVSVTVEWRGHDVGTAGLAEYVLWMQRDRGVWSAVALPSPVAHSVEVTLGPGHSYRFAARAIDRAGNVGPWAYSDPLAV